MAGRLVDLSFPLEDGMATLPGVLPEARIRPLLDHVEQLVETFKPRLVGLWGCVELATTREGR